MNIWLTFHPGSAGSIIEFLIRSYTDLSTLEIQAGKSNSDEIAKSAHQMKKQWHPGTDNELNNPPVDLDKCNIFTPIYPMPDLHGPDVFERVQNLSESGDLLISLGPTISTSLEFALIANQKANLPPTPKGMTRFNYYLEQCILQPNNVSGWNDSATGIFDLAPWELREYLSLNLPQWYFPEMIESHNKAVELGFTCFDTVDIFNNLGPVAETIINMTDGKITDRENFDKTVSHWINGQGAIHSQYNDFIMYKDAVLHDKDVDIKLENVIQEALIQHYLRERGIELKCFELNDFPSSTKLLRSFYDTA